MTISTKLSLTLVISLSGCGIGDAIQDRSTLSGFSTPNASGVISAGLTNTISGLDTDGSGGGYAYQAGALSGEGLKAVAGIIPGTNVGALPISGAATLTGTFEVVTITGISTSGDTISGIALTSSGALSLDVDFGNGTLTGSSGLLSVDGNFSSANLNGTVTYNGVSGTLDGLVGGTQTVGVFHGNNFEAIYAGGFIVD